MSKFCGVIGYSRTYESKPGVWKDGITEKDITGDLIKNTSKLETNSKVNQDITINNQISIVADPEITQNFRFIKYVKFWGVAWTVESVTEQYPRLILTLGGEYNV
ncbi:MAG: hypothetical protein PHO33_01390 [Clostridia bacterium]|jgi:hypothetical protein|nr:hypothetical protein [Clostridia bacterium]